MAAAEGGAVTAIAVIVDGARATVGHHPEIGDRHEVEAITAAVVEIAVVVAAAVTMTTISGIGNASN